MPHDSHAPALAGNMRAKAGKNSQAGARGHPTCQGKHWGPYRGVYQPFLEALFGLLGDEITRLLLEKPV